MNGGSELSARVRQLGLLAEFGDEARLIDALVKRGDVLRARVGKLLRGRGGGGGATFLPPSSAVGGELERYESLIRRELRTLKRKETATASANKRRKTTQTEQTAAPKKTQENEANAATPTEASAQEMMGEKENAAAPVATEAEETPPPPPPPPSSSATGGAEHAAAAAPKEMRLYEVLEIASQASTAEIRTGIGADGDGWAINIACINPAGGLFFYIFVSYFRDVRPNFRGGFVVAFWHNPIRKFCS